MIVKAEQYYKGIEFDIQQEEYDRRENELLFAQQMAMLEDSEVEKSTDHETTLEKVTRR